MVLGFVGFGVSGVAGLGFLRPGLGMKPTVTFFVVMWLVP